MKRYIKNIFKCRVVGTWRAMLSTLSAIVIGTILAISLQSCSDNLKEDITVPGDNQGMAEVFFSIPDENSIQFENGGVETRVEATDRENTFNNINLIVFKTDGTFNTISLDNKGTDLGNGYIRYGVSLTPGTYRFYVVVNLQNYLKSISSETQLLALIDSFSPDEDLIENNLPMACKATEMKRNGSVVSNGNITIEENNTNEITAPLTFLCSKVRYTILFDARENGISKDFGEKRIRFDVSNKEMPYVTYIDYKGTLGNEEPITLVNPGFDDNTGTGWSHSVGGGFTQVSNNVAEHFNKTFNSYQDIKNCKPGEYRLEAQGFYRWGWPEGAYPWHKTPGEVIATCLYIAQLENGNEVKEPFMCLYDEDPIYINNGTSPYGYPDQIWEAAEALEKGLYNNNSVTLNLTETSTLRIGVKSVKENLYYTGDWTCFDNFKLTYRPREVSSEGTVKKSDIAIEKYEWPSKGVEYPGSANDELTPWSGIVDDWYTMDAKAWQGVAYLPENLSSDNKTVLHFPYCFGDQQTKKGEKTITLFDLDSSSDPKYDNNIYRSGLQRGMFYDVRIQVVTSQTEEDEFTLFVRVKDWKYNPEESTW